MRVKQNTIMIANIPTYVCISLNITFTNQCFCNATRICTIMYNKKPLVFLTNFNTNCESTQPSTRQTTTTPQSSRSRGAQTTYFRPSRHPDRAIDLSCRAVRVLGAGLGFPVGDLRFSPRTSDSIRRVQTKTNIEVMSWLCPCWIIPRR